MHKSVRYILLMCMAFLLVIILSTPLDFYERILLNNSLKTITSDVYVGLKTWMAVLVVLCSVLIIFYHKQSKGFINWFLGKLLQIGSLTKGLERRQKIFLLFLLLVLILCRAYSITHYLLNVDEAWLYQAYGEKNPLFVFGWFPLPSNHVFQSFWAVTGSFLTPQNPIVGMRLPSLLIGLMTTYLLFCWVYKYKGIGLAIILVILFNSIEGVIWSQTAARGYGFMLFFHLLNILCYAQWRRTHQNEYMILFMISSIVGLYTSLSFFYYFFGVGLLWFFDTRSNGLITIGGVIFIVLFLYFPIYIINGAEPFFNYPSSSHDVLEYLSSLKPSFSWSFYFSSGWLIPLAILCMALFAQRWLVFVLLFPLVAAFIHGTQPAGKIWVPQMAVLAIVLADVFSEKANKLTSKTYLHSVLVVLLLVSQYCFFRSFGRKERQIKFDSSKKVMEAYSESKMIETVYSNDTYFLTVAEYYKKINGAAYHLSTNLQRSVPQKMMNMVVLNKDIPTLSFDSLKYQREMDIENFVVWVNNPTQ